MVSSSCSSSHTRLGTLVIHPVINTEKAEIVITTSGAYPWSFITQIFRDGKQSHGSDRKTFELTASLNYRI
jgi:hypothetical protein